MRIPRRTDLDYKNIPGRIVFELQEVASSASRRGFSLAMLRKMLGGDEGYIIDPYREESHFVSLKEWAKTKPDVELAVMFDFIPDPAFVQAHPEQFPAPPTNRQPSFVRDNRARGGDASTDCT